MRALLLEGTSDEVNAVLSNEAIRDSGFAAAASVTAVPAVDGQQYISEALAIHMLQRRPLSKEQVVVLKTLYSAHPKMVLATALAKKLNFERRQFSGLMGAFGNRLTHTQGWKKDHWFFRQEWNNNEACYQYGLPDSVRTALQKINLI